MKKIIAFVFTVLMFVSIPFEALAEVPDFSAMSDEELHELVNGARNELTKRELVAGEKVVIFDNEGVQIYLTGKNEVEDYGDAVYLYVEAVVVNDSDRTVGVANDGASVNGWEVSSSGIYDVSAGKKKKDVLEFQISDADISMLEEVEDIDLTIRLYDGDSYESFYWGEEFTIQFNQ